MTPTLNTIYNIPHDDFSDIATAELEKAASSEIILFRGDREFIHKFKYDKTDPMALYGRGIYLTEDPEMAATYRTKTTLLKKTSALTTNKEAEIKKIFEGRVASAEEAIEKAFSNFYRKIDPYGHILVRPWRKRITRKHHEVILQTWEKIKLKLVICKAENYSRWSFGIEPINYPETVIVKYEDVPHIGRVTVFKFPRQELLDKTIDVSLGNKLQAEDKALLLGVRYTGGLIMGDREHQCFVLWKEDYVNAHRIRSIR